MVVVGDALEVPVLVRISVQVHERQVLRRFELKQGVFTILHAVAGATMPWG